MVVWVVGHVENAPYTTNNLWDSIESPRVGRNISIHNINNVLKLKPNSHRQLTRLVWVAANIRWGVNTEIWWKNRVTSHCLSVLLIRWMGQSVHRGFFSLQTFIMLAASIHPMCAVCRGFIAYVLLTNECFFFPSWQHKFMGNPTWHERSRTAGAKPTEVRPFTSHTCGQSIACFYKREFQ